MLEEQDLAEIKRRLTTGLADRKKFEPLWHECLAFASGRQFVKWQGTGTSRRLVSETPKPGVDRYVVDELAQYRQTVLGELSLDDDRPQLLFRQDTLPDENYAEQANDAVGYAWDYEVDADKSLTVARRHLVDTGTSAIRCQFDKTQGPVRAEVPHFQGTPIYNVSQALRIMDDGGQLDFQDVHEGRIRWEAGSPFNLIVPPGVPSEDDFPWECWVDVVYLPTLRERFPGIEVKPDAVAPLTSVQPDDESPDGQSGRAKLDDHAWLYTYYERPCQKYPKGRVVHLAGADMKPVQLENELPYEAPDGTKRSGIHYFHYIRLSDRFWSRSMIELGLQPARAYSKRRTQIGATIDRGQPKVMYEEGSIKKPPTGLPMEALVLKPGKPQPQVWGGVPVGGWMQQELENLRTDLERAIGLRVSLGENPSNVNTYSQLALLRETEVRKLDPVIADSRRVVARLVEDTVYDIGRYWPKDKQVAIAGEDGLLNAFEFNATALRDAFYRVEAAKGSAKPRTQAARLQLVADIFTAALNTGAAKVDPMRWLEWLKESNEQAQPVDLPATPPDYQATFAEYAKAILSTGQLPPLPDYVDPAVLIPSVRELQTQAILSENAEVEQACMAYLQVLLFQQQVKNAQHALEQATVPPPPGMPLQPPVSEPPAAAPSLSPPRP